MSGFLGGGGGGGSGIVIGTTTINGGTNNYVLYDNGGVVGVEAGGGTPGGLQYDLQYNNGSGGFAGDTATTDGAGHLQVVTVNGAYLYGDASGNTGLVGAATLDLAGGIFNLFVGADSLRNTTSGSYNVAIGGLALFNNVSGNSNVAIGYEAIETGSAPSNCVGIGLQALQNSSGSQNTGVGAFAGQSIGAGAYNVAIGYATCAGSLVSGNYNTWLGAYAFPASDVSSTIALATGDGGGTDASVRLDYNYRNAGVWTFQAPPVVPHYVVASLPTGVTGAMAYVTDGTAGLTWGATVTGGHSTKYLVWYNGTNWTVMGA